MSNSYVVDANVVMKLIVEEEGSSEARALFDALATSATMHWR